MANSDTDDDVVEYDPDYSLKAKIGKDVNINDVINKSSVTEGQKVINNSQKDFLRWVENDLKTLENLYAEVLNDQSNKEMAEELKMAAFSIKAQAGTFNFALGSAVAKSLYDFMENQYNLEDLEDYMNNEKNRRTKN